MRINLTYGLALLAVVVGTAYAQDSGSATANELTQQDAMILPTANRAMMLASARLGTRIVAVGDHGVVLLSDDNGTSFRQATRVPTRTTLNDVHFVDHQEGWAAGHWGVVLHTVDGGETWTLQRRVTSVDQPLFAIYFSDKLHGLAAGLWSLLLATEDGGNSWNAVPLPIPAGASKADKNLYDIISDGRGLIIIAAEQGWIYRSPDGGKSWAAIATGSRASFWTGLVLDDRSILIAGLTGKIARSTDLGTTWTLIESGSKTSSITSLLQDSDGSIRGVGLEGLMLVSHDRGLTYQVTQREDRLSMTCLLPTSPFTASTPTGFVRLQ